MTPREQLANKLSGITGGMFFSRLMSEWMGERQSRTREAVQSDLDALAQAAAELRKVCRTCQHFERNDDIDEMLCHVEIQPDSLVGGHRYVPQDGSGYCHHWTPRTAAPEGE